MCQQCDKLELDQEKLLSLNLVLQLCQLEEEFEMKITEKIFWKTILIPILKYSKLFAFF